MLFKSIVGAFAAVGAAAAFQHQIPFTASKDNAHYDIKLASYDAGMFTPVEELNVLSQDSFTTLAHPAFPNHSVRIKKSTQFCDGDVK